MTTHDPDDEYFHSDDTGLDALDFDTPHLGDDASGLDALPDYPANEADTGNGLDFIPDSSQTPELGTTTRISGSMHLMRTVAPTTSHRSPLSRRSTPGTVAVTAYLGGSVAQVDLDPKVTALTESQLAEEIRFVAGVAATKATAVVHVGVVNMLVEQGMDLRDAREFVETNMPFATPEQAHEADLALIERHTERHD